ncbi:MFS transporter [Cohnella pontilimi]|uniref:MFS transporter n=1 Tax=Cohnella pontilimi TaxID=2564100 RepID=A0A4U0FE71_9BACL|nr:MFS transporter [Cohnella pontilimi]TJY43078.1 MFS transporter [Cohnella pontilimi]
MKINHGSQRTRLMLLSAATILYWASMYIYVPILSPYLESRGLSVGWIGFIIGSYGITQIVVRLPLGLYSDAMRRRKPFLIAGLLAGALSCVLFLLPGTWGGPLGGRLLAGLCASAWVPFSVLYASYYPQNKTSQAMGTLSFLTVSGQLAGMLGSGWLTEVGGWDTAFRTGIVLAVIGILVVLLVHEPKTDSAAASTHESRLDLKAIFRSATLWKVSSLSVLAHAILFITMFGFTPLYAVKLGANEAQLTGIVASFMIPHAIVSLISGRILASRFGTKPLLIMGFLLAGVCTALMPYCQSLGWLAVTQGFNGAAQALYFPLLLGMAIQGFPGSLRASAMGLFQSVYSVGMFLGPYLAGALNAMGGLKAGFLFGAALGIVAAMLAAVFSRRPSAVQQEHSRYESRASN